MKKKAKGKTLEKLPTGRPTKFKPEYCDLIVKFFSIDPTTEKDSISVDKKGNEITVTRLVANRLPTFHVFADMIGVDQGTVIDWANEKNADGSDKYPGFPQAYKKAKELQKFFIIENAINGVYNPVFSIFVLKNISDMRDHYEVENTVKEKRVIIDGDLAE